MKQIGLFTVALTLKADRFCILASWKSGILVQKKKKNSIEPKHGKQYIRKLIIRLIKNTYNQFRKQKKKKKKKSANSGVSSSKRS